ncbi:MAG: SDR family NAD(P)-dependent oxidoreductase [bacterium]|nr:SDR family NAD(P)-dependent oxidoreductase [bacterium]
MKTVLITGASRGIGRALAKKFLDSGYFVIGTSTTGRIDIKNDDFKTFQLDLSKPESIEKCARDIAESGKKIDVLINNAGTVVEEEVGEPAIVIDYLRKTLEVNLIGTVDFTEQIILLMNDGSQIINISSRAGSFGAKDYTLNYPSYRISKAGLNMVTKILAARLANNIKVSSVHPGWVKTDMGGEEADIAPEEVAEDLFKLVNSDIETGQFWYKGEKFPW